MALPDTARPIYKRITDVSSFQFLETEFSILFGLPPQMNRYFENPVIFSDNLCYNILISQVFKICRPVFLRASADPVLSHAERDLSLRDRKPAGEACRARCLTAGKVG